jgi:hypothetical protein
MVPETAPPESKREEFSKFAQRAFAGRFSTTAAINALWLEAQEGKPDSRRGFNGARDKFWALVRRDSRDAQTVRAVLEAAGFDLAGDGAPRLRDDLLPADAGPSAGPAYEAVSERLRRESSSRRRTPLTPEERPHRRLVQGRLEIDHAFPGNYKGKPPGGKPVPARRWLNPENLQFMLGDDNEWHKGNRYTD